MGGEEREISMADSMVASLLNTVDSSAVGAVAHALGQPEQMVSRGMESSIAGLLGALASKSSDPSALQRILDIVPSTPGAVSWSQIAGSLADPNSSLMAAGRRLLPALFGDGENVATTEISRACGLPVGAISTLLAMAGPVVMSFISKQVRDGGMTIDSLGSLLQRESASIRSSLPSGLSEYFWPATTTATVSPVVAQAVQKERSSSWILPALVAAAAIALGLSWLLNHGRRPIVHVTRIPTGNASRLAIPTRNLVCTLPGSVTLPQGGVESRLLAFVQDPGANVQEATWLDMDQLKFDTGSATLRSGSKVQLHNIATILTSCPNVQMTIAGYTDNLGTPEANLRLSRDRANSVVALLVSDGVTRDRLAAAGYGKENPAADNSTAEGRAQNRRVAMRVTQK
jgi:outer membrane protein OmpA-like peptidoglycan-associated protein